MPALQRGKNGEAAVVLGASGLDGAAERRYVPALVTLAAPYPTAFDGTDATPVTAGSGNVANASAVATISAVAGKTAYVTGFDIVGGGATAAALVAPTLAGVIGGTKTYVQAVVAGATLANPILSLRFTPAIPASAANTAIVLTCPALGAGSTNNTANIYGFYL